MGSAFSEGAIQQHIAKLRNQMAELNVAPVPGPPRRGNVTKKPSSIYTQKARAGPLPPAPPPASKAHVQTMNQPESDVQGRTGKARSKRRAPTRNVTKRSASDVGDSDEEFAGVSSDDEQPEETAGNRKRKQSRVSQGRGNTERRVSNSQAAAMSKTNEIMRALSDADARFEAHYGSNRSPPIPVQDSIFIAHNSIEGNDFAPNNNLMPQSGIDGFAGYTMNNGQEDEEEEEGLPIMARKQLLSQRAAGQAPISFNHEEQISPTSTSHMVSNGLVLCLAAIADRVDISDIRLLLPTVQCSRSRRIQFWRLPTGGKGS